MLRRLARDWLRRLGVDVEAQERRNVPQDVRPAASSRSAAGVDSAPPIAHRGSSPAGGPGIPPTIPDGHLYSPVFSPWLGYGDFGAYYAAARPYTLVSADRCHVLLTLVRQALALYADFVECGVYKGGTAILMAKALAASGSGARLCLFDTFEGMPATDPSRDLHRAGDFADTSRAAVEARVLAVPGARADRIALFPGWIPDTFADARLERVALAHVDVDIHRSVIDCCEHLYPRVVDGGFMVFDDYGFPSCPGARAAVDEYFRDKPERPLVLPTGQAVVFRHRAAR